MTDINWVDDPDRAEPMATVTGDIEPEPGFEAAGSYLRSDDAEHYRNLLAEAAKTSVAPPGREQTVAAEVTRRVEITQAASSPPVVRSGASPIGVYVEVDPQTAAAICQHQLGRLGIERIQHPQDVAEVVATYINTFLEEPPSAMAERHAWVRRIGAVQASTLGEIDEEMAKWPPFPPEGTRSDGT